MSGYLNKVQIIGNLGKDPEVRHTQDGKKIVNLGVATSEYWKDKATGEKRDKTEWHTVVIFNERLGEIAEKYLTKGSKVYLEGQLQTREWEDNTGIKRRSTEIVLQNFKGELMLMGSKGDNQGADQGEPFLATQNTKGVPSYGKVKGSGADMLDDEIPF